MTKRGCGRVGVPTIMVQGIAPNDLQKMSEKAKRKSLNRGERKKRDICRRQRFEEILFEMIPFVFCVVCGEKIPHIDESVKMWGKRRRCAVCLAAGRSSETVRYCRVCGKAIHEEEYNVRPHASPMGWRTLSCCEGCLGEHANIHREATRRANQEIQ